MTIEPPLDSSTITPYLPSTMFLGIHSPTRRMILRTALDLYVREAAVASGRGAAIPAELLEAVEAMKREINAAEHLGDQGEKH